MNTEELPEDVKDNVNFLMFLIMGSTRKEESDQDLHSRLGIRPHQ